jgi:alpha-tubulin suppressor-like RCC1 family protein
VSAGRAHTCAIGTDDRVYCWGANAQGQLGNGSTTASSSPAAAHGGRAFAMLAAGGNRTCAIQAGTGIAFCWGSNDSAALGVGSPLPFEPAPRPVPAP